MTPLDKPSAPARNGFDASWTSRSEKTTAAPSAVAEPATVVSTKPSSAFVRPIVARRRLVYFAVWLLGFTATKMLRRFVYYCACKHEYVTDATARTVQAAESAD